MFVLSKGKPGTVNLIKDRKNKWAGTKCHGTARMPSGEMLPDGAPSNRNKGLVKPFGVRFNVWDVNEEKNSKKIGHPAVFPERLARDHIITWSNEGDTVLDPLMGSGTTGKMAIQLGRKFIGIEKEKEYIEIASKRLENATRATT